MEFKNIFFIILAAVVLGGGYFFYNQKNGAKTVVSEKIETQSISENEDQSDQESEISSDKLTSSNKKSSTSTFNEETYSGEEEEDTYKNRNTNNLIVDKKTYSVGYYEMKRIAKFSEIKVPRLEDEENGTFKGFIVPNISNELAAKFKIQQGDKLISINSKSIVTLNDAFDELARIKSDLGSNNKALRKIKIRRDDQTIEKTFLITP